MFKDPALSRGYGNTIKQNLSLGKANSKFRYNEPLLIQLDLRFFWILKEL